MSAGMLVKRGGALRRMELIAGHGDGIWGPGPARRPREWLDGAVVPETSPA